MNATSTQRAPRSGGRTATRDRRETRDPGSGSGKLRSDRRDFRTEGSVALQPEKPAAPAPELRVAPPAPVAGPRAPFVLVVLVVVIGGVLGILLLNTKINENAFRLDDMHRQQASLNVQQEQLEQELAVKGSAGSLEAEARRLGLVPAGTPAYLRLPDGRLLGVPQPASGAPSVTSQTAPGGR